MSFAKHKIIFDIMATKNVFTKLSMIFLKVSFAGYTPLYLLDHLANNFLLHVLPLLCMVHPILEKTYA